MSHSRSALAFLLTTLALAGCGGGGEKKPVSTAAAPGARAPSSSTAVEALLDRLPGEMDEIAVIDLATARRQLGVPADTDPADRLDDDDPRRGRLDDAAVKMLSYLIRPPKAVRAIDHGRVTAAVAARGSSGNEVVVLLATRQPRSEIERGLQAAKSRAISEDAYDFVTGSAGFDGTKVLVFGDGLVVLASSLDIARGVLNRTARDGRLDRTRALLDSVGGAFRVVKDTGSLSREDEPCIRTLAGGARFDAHGGEDLVLALSETPAAERVVLDKGAQRTDILTHDFDVAKVAVRGRTLHLTLDLRSDAIDNSSAASIAFGEVQPEQVYDCKAAGRRPPALPSSGSDDPPPLIAPPAPDRSGTDFETAVSAYISAGSVAPDAVRVRCDRFLTGDDLHCKGTRPHVKGSGTYHYTIVVHLKPNRHIKSLDIQSPDDKTKTIVE